MRQLPRNHRRSLEVQAAGRSRRLRCSAGVAVGGVCSDAGGPALSPLPGTTRQRKEPPHTYDEWVFSEVGTRSHRLIAAFAVSGSRPSPAQVLAACVADLEAVPVEGRTRRRGVLNGVRSCVNIYAGVAWPGDGWRCTGAEVTLGRRRADLVWTHTGGSVVIDELKTGVGLPGPDDEQVAGLLAGGTAAYGAALVGVRVVPLSAISTMWLACPDGTVRPLGHAQEVDQ